MQTKEYDRIYATHEHKWVNGNDWAASNDPNILQGSYSPQSGGYLIPIEKWAENHSFTQDDLDRLASSSKIKM